MAHGKTAWHLLCGNYGLAARRRLADLVGVDNRLATFARIKADNRLCVFIWNRTNTPGPPGVFSGKKIFFLDKTLLSGQYNLEINFQFQKTIILGKMKVGTLLSNYHIQYTEF